MDVEFNDINGNRVGVDVGGVVSLRVADLGGIGVDLKTGNLINSWIDYNGAAGTLQVSVSYSNLKPEKPIFSVDIDLSKEFTRKRNKYRKSFLIPSSPSIRLSLRALRGLSLSGIEGMDKANAANNVVEKGFNPGLIVLLLVGGILLVFLLGNYALYMYAQKTLPTKKKKPVSKKKMKKEKLKQGVSAPGE